VGLVGEPDPGPETFGQSTEVAGESISAVEEQTKLRTVPATSRAATTVLQ